MQIDKTKLKKFWGYFILGIACIICAIIYLLDVGNDKTKNDFEQIEVRIAHPIKYIKSRGKHPRPYLRIFIKEYPIYYFEVYESQINNLSELKKNIFTGDRTRQGDSISLTIYQEDFLRMQLDIAKLKISTYNLDKTIEILGMTHQGIKYLKFDVNEYNSEKNSSKWRTFYLFMTIGLACFITGRYRWKKNYRW